MNDPAREREKDFLRSLARRVELDTGGKRVESLKVKHEVKQIIESID
jgi:hypothetical protein